MTVTISQDRTLIRDAGGSRRFVLARITAPVAPKREQRLPVNVAIVLDRSGSMQAESKFDLARPAVEQALMQLRPDDRFSLVVYDERVDVIAPSRPATPEAVADALRALASIRPRGSTDLGGGWLAGCDEIARHLERGAISRCLLLTDGLANYGITDPRHLSRLAEDMRDRGIATSTLGVGADFDEVLLRDLAHDGGGNAWFIEGAAQIPELLRSELGEALEVTMREASLVIELPDGCTARPIGRFRRRVTNNRYTIEVGDLVSGQTLDVVVETRFPTLPSGETVEARFELRSRGFVVAGTPCTATWTSAGHAENDAQPRNVEVDRAVATQFVARARAEATEANRRGDYRGARRVLERTSRRIRDYAGNDRVLRDQARSLRHEVDTYAEAMSPMALKMSFYVAENAGRGRERSGRAKR